MQLQSHVWKTVSHESWCLDSYSSSPSPMISPKLWVLRKTCNSSLLCQFSESIIKALGNLHSEGRGVALICSPSTWKAGWGTKTASNSRQSWGEKGVLGIRVSDTRCGISKGNFLANHFGDSKSLFEWLYLFNTKKVGAREISWKTGIEM